MKGIVVTSLGESRYTVKVKTSNALLEAEIIRLTDAYGASTDRLNALMISTAAAKAEYDAAMEQVYVQGRELQICLDDSVTFEAGLNAACNDAYGACLTKCEEGENEKLLFCFAECDRDREKCRLDIPDQLTKYLQDCHKNHAEAIAKAQSAAYKKMTELQNAKRIEALEKARRIELAIKKETFEALASREVIYTVFSAQYTDDLAPGAEVEIATTPDGHHAITSMIAQSNCLHEGRTLPAPVLFIDAALAPGAETWRPTWRVGTVLEVLQDTLKVRVTGGTLPGSLGTEISVSGIDCTPPQAYFDGNWADETAIQSAREALTAAQEALAAIYASRAACESSYDLNACRDPAWAACDVQWSQWLQDCLAVNPPEDCQDAYAQSLNGCKEQALAACYVLRDAHIEQCLYEHPSAQQEADVLAAEAALRLALSNRYRPASPLELELPVAHCSASNYEVDDIVLIDFPDRSSDPNNPMSAWNSAQVIGWHENTKSCNIGYLCFPASSADPYGYDASWVRFSTATTNCASSPIRRVNGGTVSVEDNRERGWSANIGADDTSVSFGTRLARAIITGGTCSTGAATDIWADGVRIAGGIGRIGAITKSQFGSDWYYRWVEIGTANVSSVSVASMKVGTTTITRLTVTLGTSRYVRSAAISQDGTNIAIVNAASSSSSSLLYNDTFVYTAAVGSSLSGSMAATLVESHGASGVSVNKTTAGSENSYDLQGNYTRPFKVEYIKNELVTWRIKVSVNSTWTEPAEWDGSIVSSNGNFWMKTCAYNSTNDWWGVWGGVASSHYGLSVDGNLVLYVENTRNGSTNTISEQPIIDVAVNWEGGILPDEIYKNNAAGGWAKYGGCTDAQSPATGTIQGGALITASSSCYAPDVCGQFEDPCTCTQMCAGSCEVLPPDDPENGSVEITWHPSVVIPEGCTDSMSTIVNYGKETETRTSGSPKAIAWDTQCYALLDWRGGSQKKEVGNCDAGQKFNKRPSVQACNVGTATLLLAEQSRLILWEKNKIGAVALQLSSSSAVWSARTDFSGTNSVTGGFAWQSGSGYLSWLPAKANFASITRPGLCPA